MKYLLSFIFSLLPLYIWSADGDTFKAQTTEGVEMTFKVISEQSKTCQVGDNDNDASDRAIDMDYSGFVTIPSQVNGYTVTSIGSYAFDSCSNLRSVNIPNSVTSIGNYAFSFCTDLWSITIPNSVTSIGSFAFYSSLNLSSINIPSSVTTIGEGAFSGMDNLTIMVDKSNTKYDSRDNCNAIIETESNILIAGNKNTVIPNSVTSIGSYVFYDCYSLTSIDIPNSVTSIGDNAFRNCISLTSIDIPNSVTSIGSWAFNYCTHLTSINIPNSVTSIGDNAFSSCSNLTSIDIPNSVTSIGDDAFSSCSNLTSINIPNSVTSIGSYAFRNCTSLTSIDIPNSVTSIGSSAFSGCTSLTSIDIPNSVTSIGDNAFNGCTSLTSIDIPNSVTSIGYYAFSGCTSLTSIDIPNSVTSIGSYAFQNCSRLTKVRVEKTTPIAIKSSTFSIRANATLYVPKGSKAAYQAADYWKEFKEIVEYEVDENITFADAEVKAICVKNWDTNGDGELSKAEAAAVKDLGEVFKRNTSIKSFDELQYFTGLTIIGSSAFYNCSRLTSITIPSSVTSIEGSAFLYCYDLANIKVDSGNKYYDSRDACNAIIETKNNTLIVGCKNTIIPSSVTSIGSHAFGGCVYLNSIAIPSSVTSIGSRAFAGCTNLLSITIPGSVTSIGESVFGDCSCLTSIKVDSGNKYYDSRDASNAIIETKNNTLIAGCKNTIIPSSVTSIGEYAFFGCSGLTSITIPSSVTSIGEYAFYNCSRLAGILIPNSVTSIGCYAFYSCKSLTSVTISSSVTSIDHYAFYNCSGLTGILIPSSVTSIGNHAFYSCSSLTNVIVERATPYSIDSETFSNRANATLYVPKGSKAAYQAADYWKEFKEIVEYEVGENITFADAEVKALCVKNWDTNGDGELSKAETLGVSNLGTVFKGNTSIRTFDELQYFTGLTTIPDGAFRDCINLISIIIPQNVSTIGDWIFSGCSSLNTIIVDNKNKVYDSRNNCNAVIETSSNTLRCGCKNMSIPNSVIAIGERALVQLKGLETLEIPNSVTSIGSYAFAGSDFTSVIIPNSVTDIETFAFQQCNNLLSVSIPNSVTELNGYQFYQCQSLKSVSLPNTLKSIGSHVFAECPSLASVNIPKSVTAFHVAAFLRSNALKTVKNEMIEPVGIVAASFPNRANATLYVPKGSKAAYQAADYWKEFKTILEFPDTDVNQDGATDVVDVVDIARYVVGSPSDSFHEFLADLNSDDKVNVADAVVLVNDIAGNTSFAKAWHRMQSSDDVQEQLMLTKNKNNSLSLCMDNSRAYTAFQFDLMMNNDMNVMQMLLNESRKNGHQLLYNKVGDGHYRVVALSTANNSFNGKNGELLNIQLDGFDTDDLTIHNVHFFTGKGNDYAFDDLKLQGGTTAIEELPFVEGGQPSAVYDLQGRKQPTLRRGVNIVNGKKVIIK